MANQARFYCYRNLNTDTFSVLYRGKVIEHPTTFAITNVRLRVGVSGREKVRKNRVKNVHAKVSGVSIGYPSEELIDENSMVEIFYDPYLVDNFVVKSTGEEVFELPILFGKNNRIFTPKSSFTEAPEQPELFC